jgi:hypothetical protein
VLVFIKPKNTSLTVYAAAHAKQSNFKKNCSKTQGFQNSNKFSLGGLLAYTAILELKCNAEL